MSKGTASMGKHNSNKTHIMCRRCGKHTYHVSDKECSSCGFGKSTKKRTFAWLKK